jgi:hypothetical protein
VPGLLRIRAAGIKPAWKRSDECRVAIQPDRAIGNGGSPLAKTAGDWVESGCVGLDVDVAIRCELRILEADRRCRTSLEDEPVLLHGRRSQVEDNYDLPVRQTTGVDAVNEPERDDIRVPLCQRRILRDPVSRPGIERQQVGTSC